MEKYERELKESEVVDSGNQGSVATGRNSAMDDPVVRKKVNLEDMCDSKGSVDSGTRIFFILRRKQCVKSHTLRNKFEIHYFKGFIASVNRNH